MSWTVLPAQCRGCAAHTMRCSKPSQWRAPPDPLIDAMQTGDRLGYHPERAVDEIAHLHQILPEAQAAVSGLAAGFSQRLDAYAARMQNNPLRPADMDAEKKARLIEVHRADLLVGEASK